MDHKRSRAEPDEVKERTLVAEKTGKTKTAGRRTAVKDLPKSKSLTGKDMKKVKGGAKDEGAEPKLKFK